MLEADSHAAPILRMRRNRDPFMRGAVALLLCVALASLVGPWLGPHAYDRVFPDYVRVPPSLAAHPFEAETAAALQRVAARLHARVVASEAARDGLRVTLEAAQPIDTRALVYFPRSDLFGMAGIEETRDEGRRLTLAVPLKYNVFPLGTDANGRDLLSRSLMAGRVSLAVGLLASGVALAIGVAWGAVASYLGGAADQLMMRVVDILYAMPFIFFVILLVVFFGRHFVLVFAAIGAVEWLDMARITRAQTQALKHQEFVQAAEALGATTPAILFRHILPNLATPVVIYLTLLIPKVILTESFISFVGLGVQEPLSSWGILIADGARAIQGAPWMVIPPAVLLTATLLALNVLGDALRDWLDPRDS